MTKIWKRSLVFAIIVMIIGASIIPITTSDILIMKSSGNTLYVGGSELGNYTNIQDAIDNASNGDTVFVYNKVYYENVVIDKSINLKGENKYNTVIDGSSSGDVVYISVDWVNISKFTIQNSGSNWNDAAIEITTNFNNISDNRISPNNYDGIWIYDSAKNNTIIGNNIQNNHNGIVLENSNNNIISGNNISSNNYDGIWLTFSNNNVIYRNNISSNLNIGIYLWSSNNNIIFHNNLIDNNQNAFGTHINQWDNDYPSGGNHWDDYNGNDDYNGPNQDIPGSDGIGDAPYNISGGSSKDNYPLMEPWNSSNQPPTADFTYSPLNPTTIDIISFTDNSSDPDGNIVNWTWNFNDGNISYQQNPTHSYSDDGTYNITLIVRDDDEASNSTYKIITVINAGGPTADFNWTPSNPTTQDEIQFTSLSTNGGIVNWTWNFSDGNISYEENPIHNYSDDGRYNVELKVLDNNGTNDSTTKQVDVSNVPPTAEFSYTPLQSTTADTIKFTDLSNDVDGSIINWTWNFDNGNISYQQNPTQKYSNAGIYFVNLTVTDDDGANNTITKQITVFWSVLLNFTAQSNLILTDYAVFGEKPDALDDQDWYDVPKPPKPNNPYIYGWLDANLTEPYEKLWEDYRYYPDNKKTWDLYLLCDTSGTKQVYTNITISWDTDKVNESEYANGSVLLNNTQNDEKVNMILIKNYTFNATNDVIYHFKIDCNENKPPIANFSYNPLTPGTDTTIQFNDTSFDLDGVIVNWTWNFDNGNISYLQNPTQKYSNAGIYFVNLTVTDDDGANNTITKQITVFWSVSLIFTTQTNLTDNIIFGEKPDALDGQDLYDVPKPPIPGSPYIYAWFDANLSNPYEKLWEDYRLYPDNKKTWDFFVLCDTSEPKASSTNITISWISNRINESEYNVVNLYEYGNPSFLADMKNEENYSCELTSNVVYHFQIKTYAFNNILTLDKKWNLISLPFNESVNKNEIVVRNNSLDYYWSDAVSEGIVLGFFYGWNRIGQSYSTIDTLEPGYGYWMYAYYNCELLLTSNIIDNEYITNLEYQWNLMGLTSDELLDKENLIIHYNLTDYSWENATGNNNEEGMPIILGFIYGWNRIPQNYILSDEFEPGLGYWIYAYYKCTLFQPET